MWNKPKKYTELDLVRKEVGRRRKIAEDKGLDTLFLDAYHGSIRHYPFWLAKNDKRYVHPDVLGASEKTIKDPEKGDTFITDFKMGTRNYRITSRRHGTFLTGNVYYVMELYLDGRKVFGVSEEHQPKTRGGRKYYALGVNAYASEDWVDDFKKILAYKEKVDREAGPEPNPEDPATIKQLKEDFNIDGGAGPSAAAEEKGGRAPESTRSHRWLWFAILVLAALLLLRILMSAR